MQACNWRELGSTLAGALPSLSLDIVSLVASYVAYGVARPGVLPNVLHEFSAYADHTTKWGHRYSSSGLHLSCSSDNKIWLADFEQPRVFDLSGKFLFRAALELESPFAITCDRASSMMYCASPLDGSVAVCSLDGKTARVFTIGDVDAQDIAVDSSRNLIAVADYHNDRICVFDCDGKVRFDRSKCAKGKVNRPRCVVFNKHGQICVGNGEVNEISVRKLAFLCACCVLICVHCRYSTPAASCCMWLTLAAEIWRATAKATCSSSTAPLSFGLISR